MKQLKCKIAIDYGDKGKKELAGACEGCARFNREWTILRCRDMIKKTGEKKDGVSSYGACWRPEGVALIWKEDEE
jgi:hypothetical protein